MWEGEKYHPPQCRERPTKYMIADKITLKRIEVTIGK